MILVEGTGKFYTAFKHIFPEILGLPETGMAF
jgi:hypothetical protein